MVPEQLTARCIVAHHDAQPIALYHAEHAIDHEAPVYLIYVSNFFLLLPEHMTIPAAQSETPAVVPHLPIAGLISPPYHTHLLPFQPTFPLLSHIHYPPR